MFGIIKKYIFIIVFLLGLYHSVCGAEDMNTSLENYFNSISKDSPAYNFSVLFLDSVKINSRGVLENKLEESIFILIEQEPNLDVMYLGVPLVYKETGFSKTLNLTYKKKKEKVTVLYDLTGTYGLEKFYVAVFEIKKQSRTGIKTDSGKTLASRLSTRFSQIKLDKEKSLYRFYNFRKPLFLLGGNTTGGKTARKAKGKVVVAGNALNMVVSGEKVSVQQGEIAFDLNALSKLPPTPDTLIVITEKPNIEINRVEEKNKEDKIAEQKKEEQKSIENAVTESDLKSEVSVVQISDTPSEETKTEAELKTEAETETPIIEAISSVPIQTDTEPKTEPKFEIKPETIETELKNTEDTKEIEVKKIEPEVSEYKGKQETVKEFRAGEYIFPVLSEPAFEGPDLIIIKDNVQLISPNNNGIITKEKLAFKWSKFDKAVKYRIEITGNTFVSPLIRRELNEVEFELNSAEAGGIFAEGKTYYWRVIAINAAEKEISKTDEKYMFAFSEPKIFEEPALSVFKILNNDIESISNGHIFLKDDLINNAFVFSAELEKPLDETVKLSISIDGGEYYTMSKSGDKSYIFEYKPTGDKIIKISAAYQKNNETIELKNTSWENKEFIYVHKTNAELVRLTLDKYFRALQTKDRDLYMECFSGDFSGNNEGFTSFSEIRTTIRRVFDKQTFLSASYNGLNADIKNADRAEAEFDFYFKIYFEGIGFERELRSSAKLQLKKEEGFWKILNDDSKLFVMEIFAPSPPPPAE
ncbi:MAG TPA: hypothetical protein PLQ81_00610 [bacterium]|nr:hypothetical protein [bacterium]